MPLLIEHQRDVPKTPVWKICLAPVSKLISKYMYINIIIHMFTFSKKGGEKIELFRLGNLILG